MYKLAIINIIGGLIMAQEIEIEFKNLLTKSEFDALLTAYHFPKNGQTQVNYYFETKQLELQQKHCALRIRKKNDSYQLTLKEPHKDGILETHDSLTKDEALKSLSSNIVKKSHTSKQLDKLNININDIFYCGSLTTIRHEVSYNGVLLVLDYSIYNNHSDYELELEAGSKDVGSRLFYKILAEQQIKKRRTPNKIERFFSTLNER